MTLRTRYRRIRLFYKAMPYIFDVLRRPYAALLLPLISHEVTFHSKQGLRVSVPGGDWDLLPNMCRLAAIGAGCRIEGDYKRIEIDGLTLFSPKQDRVEGDFLREIFREDVYRMKGRALTGKVAVDIGAYLGDSSIPMARMGATVYAFEPSSILGDLIRRNLAANGVAKAVHFFNVGLSDATLDVPAREGTLHFVDGVPFLLDQVPGKVDLLKMDCEGCEYSLVEDTRFLDHLAPTEIVMEYHRGEARLAELLRKRGYRIEVEPSEDRNVGYLYATLATVQSS